MIRTGIKSKMEGEKYLTSNEAKSDRNREGILVAFEVEG